MSLIVKEVTSDRDLQTFIRFPNQLYSGSRCFVPKLAFDEESTLRRDKNPAFEYCESRYWLAFRNGKPVGRIAAILNHAYIHKWKNPYMRFGWIDFENDIAIARALLGCVENWAREKKLSAVHGPMGFTDLDHEGMLVEGFDEPGTLATIYNFPYYPRFLEQLGYVKDADWVEYKIKMPESVPENISRLAAIVCSRKKLNILRPKKPREILPYAKELFELVNTTYEDLYGVVPLSEKQIQYYTRQYFSFIRTDFITLITDRDGKLAAFGIAMPSLSVALQKAKGRLFPFGFFHLLSALRKNSVADLYLIAIRPDLQGKAVTAVIMNEFALSFIRNGIHSVESNPELENNVKVQSLWDHFEARRHKRRRCYIKKFALV